MAHNLVYNTITKKTEFMSRGAAWHELGQVVENATTWEETIQLAGLDWSVEKRQLLTPNGQKIPRLYGVFRTDKDNDLDGYLGNVGENFTPIPIPDAFKFVDTLMEVDGDAHYEAAGALGKGETVFCLANIGSPFEVVDGDRHENYLLFVNTFNSNKSSSCLITSVRVVCANTLQMALSRDGAAALTFRRTSGIKERMRGAQLLITDSRQTTADLAEKLRFLAGREMTKPYRDAVIDALIAPPSPEAGKTAVSKRQVRVDAILKNFERNDGANGFKSVEGTAYNLLNAYTEYVDHDIPVVRTAVKDGMTDAEIRASRALLDDGATDKASALDAILQIAQNAPLRVLSRSYAAGIATAAPAPELIDDSIFDDDLIDG